MARKNEEMLSTRKDLGEFEERMIHQFKIISEDLREKIELVAEGVTNVNEKLSRAEQRLTEKIADVEDNLSAIIRVSYIDLTKRVDDLDRRVKELEKSIRH
jgi:hypothetical protein